MELNAITMSFIEFYLGIDTYIYNHGDYFLLLSVRAHGIIIEEKTKVSRWAKE